MDIRDGFSGSVGNTPLIKLKKASELTECDILGKAEFLNPGGSVKDRAALYMILDAEREGTLQPGGVIVEGTVGNTGIGLAIVANARGYRTVIVIPETQSREKMDMLRLCGAELMPVPAKPYKDPENYVRKSERVAAEYAAKEPNGALWANQWDNPANWKGHYESTAPEIWAQTDGKIDGFICAMGTGGTLAGISTFMKEMDPDEKTASPIRWGRRCTAISRPANWRAKAVPSPKGSARGGSPIMSLRRRWTCPIRYRTKRRCRSYSIC